MGRRKIEIKAIKDDRNRSVTFLKRKGGLFKKAHELSVLCSVEVAVVIWSGHNAKLYEFSSEPDIRGTIQRSLTNTPHEHKGPADFMGRRNTADASAPQDGSLNDIGQPENDADEDDDEDASGEDASGDHVPSSQQQQQQQQYGELGQPPMQGQTKSKRGSRTGGQKRQSSVAVAPQHPQPNMIPLQHIQHPQQHLQHPPPPPHMQGHPGFAPHMTPQGYTAQLLPGMQRPHHSNPYAPSVSPPMNTANAGMLYGHPQHGLSGPSAPPGSRHGSFTTATGTPQSQPQGPPSRPVSRNMPMSMAPSSAAVTPDLSHQHQQLGMATPPTTTTPGPAFYPPQQQQHSMQAPPPPHQHQQMGLPPHMQPHGYIHPHQHAAYLSAADANRRSSMPLHPGYTHSPQGTPVPMPVNMPVPAVGAGNRGNSQNPSIIVGNVDTPPSEVQGDLQGNGQQQQQQHHFLKSKSIFTPIDDRGSVLAQHLGLVSRSPPPLRAAQSPGQGQGKSQSQPQQESHPQGQERSWTEAPQTEDGQSQQQQPASHPSRTQSLPVTAGSDAAPPIPPPVSRSSIGGHLNAKRPRLTVQIPGERGSVEPDQSQKKVENDQELADDAHPADQRDNRQETDASMNNNPVSPRSNGNGNIANRRISRSTSRTPLPLPHDKDVHAGNGSHTAGGSIKEGPDGHVVLPPPSPSAGTPAPLLSAGAQGPPNPFARPHPPGTATATTTAGESTPLSAVPSRFVGDSLLPSPSNLYPEWPSGATPTTSSGAHPRSVTTSMGMGMSHMPLSMSGTAGGGMSGLMSDMLPSPLNFTTPVVPNAPAFGRENREFPRDGKGLGLTFSQLKPERKEGGEKDNEAGGSADLENSDRNEREEGHDDEGPNYGVTDKKRKQGGDDENTNGDNEREDGGKKQKLN